MDYHILNENGDIIASFKHKVDRGVCLNKLLGVFPDCKFFPIEKTCKTCVYNTEDDFSCTGCYCGTDYLGWQPKPKETIPGYGGDVERNCFTCDNNMAGKSVCKDCDSDYSKWEPSTQKSYVYFEKEINDGR